MEGQGENVGQPIFGIPAPLTVNEIYNDFVGRRAAIIKALTVDYDDFSREVDDGRSDQGHVDQCLYGHPHGGWEVINNATPVEGLPEPPKCLGSVHEGSNKKNTATRVANRSNAWLLTVVNYFCNTNHVAEADRQGLLNRIALLPTVSEVVAAFKFR